ncbi:hypothetical protein ACFPYN_08125, partial [Paenisporosarcina macmurdoensis]
GISGTGETPQIAKRPRRLTARPAESVRLKRKSTLLMNQSFCPKYLKYWIYGTKIIYLSFKKTTSP